MIQGQDKVLELLGNIDNRIQLLVKERSDLSERRDKILDKEIKLQKLRNTISKKCTHTYPNGKSAIRGGFLYSTCQICYTDF